MQFDFATLAPAECYKLMVSTIVPRPIAWVVTQEASGLDASKTAGPEPSECPQTMIFCGGTPRRIKS